MTSKELGFSAVAGRRYWISVGYHSGDYEPFERWSSSTATLRWGEVPANDQLRQATALSGGSGSTTIPNFFGTLEPNEPSGALGHSSLWWSFTPTTAGWYRFWVDDAPDATLAVYRAIGEGFAGLQRLAHSHGDWQAEDDTVVVLFEATAEERYLIRVGQRGDDAEATLNWDAAPVPVWLRYAGRLPASALGLGSDAIAFPSLTIDDQGEALYLSTSLGLHVLRRNASDGTLEQSDVVDLDTRPGHAMLWDRHRSKLYARDGHCIWRQFVAHPTRTLIDDGALNDSTSPCNEVTLFMDPAGAFLYHGHRNGVEVFAFGETGLTSVQSLEIPGLLHAVLDGDGTHVYAASDRNSLLSLSRNQETGVLATASDTSLGADDVRALAISDDDAYLFALGYARTSAVAYELTDGGAALQRIDSVSGFGNGRSWYYDSCGPRSLPRDGFIMARNASPAFDAFCVQSAFAAAMRVEDGSAKLRPQDYLANWQADRFNNYIPEFVPRAVVASPDGKHAYVFAAGKSGNDWRTAHGGILIFERVGNPPPTADPEQD